MASAVAQVAEVRSEEQVARIHAGAVRVARLKSKAQIRSWLSCREECGWDADEIEALTLALAIYDEVAFQTYSLMM